MTTSTRSKARKRALDILFESELRGTGLLETLDARSVDADPPVRDFTAELVRGVQAHQDEIDSRIAASLKPGWTLNRLPRVDRNAMRISVFEIDFSDLPDEIAISEAVQLVAALSTDDSPTFVNGVLGGVVAKKAMPA